MPLLNQGKHLMLEVFKTKMYKVSIGTGTTPYFSETVIPWDTVGSGSLGGGTLQMSANYDDIIALRYNAGAVINILRFRDSANNIIRYKTSGINTTPQETKGVYAIIDIPVTITST
jgi:hypothetical protein